MIETFDQHHASYPQTKLNKGKDNLATDKIVSESTIFEILPLRVTCAQWSENNPILAREPLTGLLMIRMNAEFQTESLASFRFPFAKHFCTGFIRHQFSLWHCCDSQLCLYKV